MQIIPQNKINKYRSLCAVLSKTLQVLIALAKRRLMYKLEVSLHYTLKVHHVGDRSQKHGKAQT
jgi:hypothetical protein